MLPSNPTKHDHILKSSNSISPHPQTVIAWNACVGGRRRGTHTYVVMFGVHNTVMLCN